jgi:tRNA(Ile)-lysidine synthase
MKRMIDRVRQFIRQHDLIRPDTRIVAAVSGGSDSVALACVLRELHARGEVVLAGLAHFNHQLRAAADRDERHTAALAASLDVPFLADREDVRARARAARRSLEDAARAARYAFFHRARLHYGADAVALGHTRDDQAETFLLRLLRGAGPRGLAAMYPRHDWVVRPLLGCRRNELREFLALRQAHHDPAAQYVDDETNTDVSIPRNRIRAELLPLLEARFNPAIVDVLANEAEVARETWQWLGAAASEAAVRLVRSSGENVQVIELPAFRASSPALQRVVLWRAMSELARGRPVGFDHVAAVLRVASGAGPAAIDAPGQRVERIGDRIVLTGRVADALHNRQRKAKPANLFRYPLSIPGEVRLAGAGCVVSAEPIVASGALATLEQGAIVGSGPMAFVSGELCGTLAVRHRRPGDRFRPIGLGGQKKLQDFFVDRKITRDERDAVPLVVDELDRIVWVAGHRIDEAFRVTEAAKHVLLLRLKALGGPA